jgi:CRISPR system Cascade subunit CasD
VNTLEGVAVRLQAPLQAWGGATVGDNRPTQPFPTRSGVLGMVAACLGILRGDHRRLRTLCADARVHVRVDAPGTPLVDDQTIQGNPNASPTRQTIRSKRTYLCDASFAAVIVPGPGTTLDEIEAALSTPKFSPYLGRRCCVPSSPLLLASRVSGVDPLELFESIPIGPEELMARIAGRQELDFYLDVEDHPRRLRRIPLRDDLQGRLPRQFRERFVVHVRADAPVRASTQDPWISNNLL